MEEKSSQLKLEFSDLLDFIQLTEGKNLQSWCGQCSNQTLWSVLMASDPRNF